MGHWWACWHYFKVLTVWVVWLYRLWYLYGCKLIFKGVDAVKEGVVLQKW